MRNKDVIDGSTVRVISKVANLSLGKNREEIVSPSLSKWIEDANELNLKMSTAKFWEIVPIPVFSHQR